ncbi:hypothetical protein ACP275_02G056300 [Erythranthe tilingii]
MVTTKESQRCQQFTAWNLPDLDHMALIQREQNPAFIAAVTFPGQPNPDFCCPNSGQPNAVGGSFKAVPPYWNNTLYPSGDPCVKDSQTAPQKRFLIFDRSGNQTRLFFSPSFPPKDQIINESRLDSQFLAKPEKLDESHLNDDGEGDMLEDSEEINALLYSDSDYDDDDDDDGDDEATSTRDSTLISNNNNNYKEGSFDKGKLLEELVEEVASSDESPKRQRLINGGYKKSSYDDDDDDAESSYAGARNSGGKRDKKGIKVMEALKIMESIIPGLESKDPLSIIEKAIGYLESMKNEAEALGVGYTTTECVPSAGLT